MASRIVTEAKVATNITVEIASKAPNVTASREAFEAGGWMEMEKVVITSTYGDSFSIDLSFALATSAELDVIRGLHW